MSERANFFIEGRKMLAKPYHYLASGLDNIFLLNGVMETETSYGPMVHIENINGLHHAIGLHIVEKNEPMRGAEFRFLRKQLGITQVKLAGLFKVTDQTIANYEKEETPMDGAAEAYLKAAYILHILPKQTRVEVMKSMIEPTALKVRKRLPDVPRRKIVEHWQEPTPQMAA
jgi:DNA-binding transcriptional regulator YiaG